MPGQELTKSIEARKLNKRSRLPLSEPPVTIPFGGIVHDLEEDRDLTRFLYLGELFQCTNEVLRDAMPKKAKAAAPAPVAVASAPAPVLPAEAVATPPEPDLQWEMLTTNLAPLWRAKVPGGWLISAKKVPSRMVFVPDAAHEWTRGGRR